MTKKELLLTALKEAKENHLDMVRHAKLIKTGFGFDTEKVDHAGIEACPFGDWLHEYKPIILRLHTCSAEHIVELESWHSTIHRLYRSLVEQLVSGKRGSFFSKLFAPRVRSKKDRDVLERIYFRMVEAEEKFSQLIDLLIKRISAVPEKEIAALFNGER